MNCILNKVVNLCFQSISLLLVTTLAKRSGFWTANSHQADAASGFTCSQQFKASWISMLALRTIHYRITVLFTSVISKDKNGMQFDINQSYYSTSVFQIWFRSTVRNLVICVYIILESNCQEACRHLHVKQLAYGLLLYHSFTPLNFPEVHLISKASDVFQIPTRRRALYNWHLNLWWISDFCHQFDCNNHHSSPTIGDPTSKI